MICPDPACAKRATVIQTRTRDDYTYRRYACAAGHRFSTVEGRGKADVEAVCDSGMAKRIRKADIRRTIEANA